MSSACLDTDLVNTKYKNETEADTGQRRLIHTFDLTPMSVVVEGALQLMADDTKNSESSTTKESQSLTKASILAEAVLCLPKGNVPMERPSLPGKKSANCMPYIAVSFHLFLKTLQDPS